MKKSILNEIKSINSIDELNAFKNELNDEIKTREEVINICETANSLKGKSFGFVKESLEALLPRIFSLAEGRDLLKKYTNVIKENKNLKSAYNFYENLNKLTENSDASLIIKEMKSMLGEINKSEMSKGLKKLDGILSEAYIWSGKGSEEVLPTEERQNYFTLAENIMYAKPSEKNLTEYYNNISVLKEMAVKHNKEKKTELDEAYDQIAEKVKTNMEVTSGSEISGKYNEAKASCLKALDEAKSNFEINKDYDSSARIELYIESINKKKFNLDTASSDIQKLNELEQCFK